MPATPEHGLHCSQKMVCKCLLICRQILTGLRSNPGQRDSWICLVWSSHSQWMRCGFWESGRSRGAHTQSALIPNREAHPCRMRENISRSTNGNPAIAGGWLATFGIATIHLQDAKQRRRSSNPNAANRLLTRASSETKNYEELGVVTCFSETDVLDVVVRCSHLTTCLMRSSIDFDRKILVDNKAQQF